MKKFDMKKFDIDIAPDIMYLLPHILDFLNYIYEDALKKIKLEAVSIIR